MQLILIIYLTYNVIYPFIGNFVKIIIILPSWLAKPVLFYPLHCFQFMWLETQTPRTNSWCKLQNQAMAFTVSSTIDLKTTAVRLIVILER